jgi:hypothetical protein
MVYFFCGERTIPETRQPHRWGSRSHTIRHTYQVGFLWRRDRPVAEVCTLQHTFTTERQLYLRRDRIHNPSKQMAAELRLRARGHRNWQCNLFHRKIVITSKDFYMRLDYMLES